MPGITPKIATIAAAGTTSSEVNLGADGVVGLDVPTIDSANLTFTVATEPGGTFRQLKDAAGNAYTVTAGTGSAYFALDPLIFAGVKNLKIVASAAQAGGARTINVITRPVS
jgi:hypothetical protein